MKLKRIYKPILILIPFILGMIGFGIAGEPVLQAVYHCICLYGMGHQELPPNVLVEIARWLAPLATAGSVVLVAKSLRRTCRRILARATGKSVAVYGPAAEKDALLKELGVRGIDMDQRPVRAHSYILLGEEMENLGFCRQHKAVLGEKDVYLKCSSLPAQSSSQSNLHLFCPEETAARFFWKEYCPFERSVQANHRMKIVLLGFGKLGRELLITGLQNNIFAADQHIEYHIFGEEKGFTKLYSQLPEISDPVIFHPEAWTESLSLIEEAHMVIVAQQEEQLSLLRDLTLALPGKALHVLAAQPDGAKLLAGQTPIVCYDWKKESMQLEHILGTRLYLYAKRINLRYAHLYEKAEETPENREIRWNGLDSFTRYSNISAADYHDVRLRMLNGKEPDAEQMERLAELEHIRWCRYHFLNNWKYGVPENGKNKDLELRIHKLLIPYGQLEEAEKEKDRENVRILLELDKEE